MTDRILTALAGLLVGLILGAFGTWHALGTPEPGWDQRAARAEVSADSALALVRRVRLGAQNDLLAAQILRDKASARGPRIAYRKAQVATTPVPDTCRTIVDSVYAPLTGDLDSSLTEVQLAYDRSSQVNLTLMATIDSLEGSLENAKRVLEDRPKRKPWLIRALPRPQLGAGLVLPLSVGSVPGVGVYFGLGWRF